jgi:hypothetical protein
MKLRIFSFILFMVIAGNINGQKIPANTSVISSMSYEKIDSMLQVKASQGFTITDRISYYSHLFLGMPYSWTATGDGAWALYEPQPLFNFDSTNCMVLCEHVLALALSDSWDHFFNNLQRIRYQDGIIGIRTRNHYTMGDWLPENSWLLTNVSRQVGGQYTAEMTRTISHTSFFKEKRITDLRYVKPDRKMTVEYIPLKDLHRVKDNVENGDILALLFADKPDIFSAHMLIMIKSGNTLTIREASNSRWTTFDIPWDTWLNKTKKSPRYAGLAVMRIRPELNMPNKIIIPREIPDLKDLKTQ